jgi:hypothetical protein
MSTKGSVDFNRKRLRDFLSESRAAGTSTVLPPDLALVALETLRNFKPRFKYQLEAVDADGRISIVAAVDSKELLRATYLAASKLPGFHNLQIRCGSEITPLEATLK